MRGAGFNKDRDLTGIRRNPGVGLTATWSCALCSKRHADQTQIRKVRFGSSWTLMCKGGCK